MQRKSVIIASAALVGVGVALWMVLRRGSKPAARPVAPAEPLLPTAERKRALELFERIKEQGNAYFQTGRYEEALEHYQHCLEICQALGASDTEAVEKSQVIRSNVTLVFTRIGRYEEARAVATMLLQDEAYPVSLDLKVKLLYRRGMASKLLGDTSSAMSDFKAAVHFSPDKKNPAAEAELNRLSRTQILHSLVVMLTPVFSCLQEEDYVVVKIILSAICKVMDAVFDINDKQFTFYCSPYYLRLVFNEALQEGKGERAVYDLESNILSVYLPKETPGMSFTELDNPGYLIATSKQRRKLLEVIDSSSAAHGDEEEEEEVEYVQSLEREGVTTGGDPYGFANLFSGVFSKVEESVRGEVVALSDPEASTVESRRRERIDREMADFDEEAVLVCFEDEEGEVEDLLKYIPPHVEDYRRALQTEGCVYASQPPPNHQDAYEEETTALGEEGVPSVEVWRGNVASFERPLIQELGEGEEGAGREAPVSRGADSVPLSRPPRTTLAVPKLAPTLTFSSEENRALITMKRLHLLAPPTLNSVKALTADILFAEAYDDIFSQGTGCCESLWNICTLSTALSYLETPDCLYDACFNFARRALIYPLYRHFGVVQRVYAVVGMRLLLGRNYVVRALLRVRSILSHSEHRHVLSTIYLDPLIDYWMNLPEAKEHLMNMALEIHEHVSRTSPEEIAAAPSAPSALLLGKTKKTLYPLSLEFLGLPFED